MLRIYNSLSREKQNFVPLNPGVVKMYVCGVTVYDHSHIGHARALITFDVVYRYLLSLGYKVDFVRNYTDVDDKIIKRANERGISCEALSQEFIAALDNDLKLLGFVKPTVEPKATEQIAEMLAIIAALESKGIAYKAGNDVFYSVRKFPSYGKLSGKNIEDLESGARIDVMDVKKDPLDFVLWKGSKLGEPSWDSPWGAGRPGWHIECSAMSMKYLGETFDIHGGGKDLVFPHHENEIAQSEGCTGHDFAKYWMHAGHLNINAEKMSKSLGNFLTIHQLLSVYPSEAIRLFLLSAHYRSPLDYTKQHMQNSVAGLERFYKTKARLLNALQITSSDAECDPALLKWAQDFGAFFSKAMDDDFNTAKVIGAIFEGVRECNRVLDQQVAVSAKCLNAILQHFEKVQTVLGVLGSSPEDFFAEMKKKGLQHCDVDATEIEALIVQRREARAQKDFAKSDDIRDGLKALGVILQDQPDGTTQWTLA